MPRYLFEVDYSTEGTKGLLKEGGSKRRAAVEASVKKLGGKLEAFYFTFGVRDAITIVELPDGVSALALSLSISASGSVSFKTTPLITAEEMDQAAKKSVSYRPPGGK